MRLTQKTKLALITALLCTATSAVGAPVASTAMNSSASVQAPSVQSEKYAAAVQMAHLVASLESMQEGARIGFQQTFDQNFRADPSVQALEKQTPGFIAFMEARMLEGALDNISVMHPIFIDRLAKLFEQELSLAHILEVTAFARTSAGRKSLKGDMSALKLDPEFTNCIQAGGENCASSGMIRGLQRQAGGDLLSQLSDAELREIIAFSQSEAGQAFNALTPQIAQVSADVVNELMPDLQARSIGTMRTAAADWQDLQKEKTKP